MSSWANPRPRTSWVGGVVPKRRAVTRWPKSGLLDIPETGKESGWKVAASPLPLQGTSIQSPSELQREAFEKIPPLILEEYHGQFVVSRDGIIEDSDRDLVELTRRFFELNGNVPVYITRIGKPIKMRTPFVR